MSAFLTVSSAKIFTNNCTNKTAASTRTLPSESEIRFFRSFPLTVNQPISLRRRTVQAVASSHISSEAEVLTGFKNANTGIETMHPRKTIHVKFQLKKECLFGEQFFLVGDHPILGTWNPLYAIPLNWSDGHIWTVELDIPVGKAIQFKCILKQCTGDILWQPGPDRVFHTWETDKTTAILEDWENAEFQKIIEDPSEELSINLQMEPILHLEEKLMANMNEDFMLSDSIASPEDDPMAKGKRGLITAEQITDSKGGNIYAAGNNASSVEDEETKPAYEEGPALVPDLISVRETSH